MTPICEICGCELEIVDGKVMPCSNYGCPGVQYALPHKEKVKHPSGGTKKPMNMVRQDRRKKNKSARKARRKNA